MVDSKEASMTAVAGSDEGGDGEDVGVVGVDDADVDVFGAVVADDDALAATEWAVVAAE